MQLDIYYSYACRDSYLVFAWLKEVKKSGQSLEMNWHPFAIQLDDPDQYWKRPWKFANSELRGFIAAEAARRQGSESFSRFHDALDGLRMSAGHDDDVRRSRLCHHFGLQVAAIHGLEVSDDGCVREGFAQGAHSMETFRQNQWRARLQPIDSSAHGQRGGFEGFIDVGEVERDLDDGFHECAEVMPVSGLVVTTKIWRNATALWVCGSIQWFINLQHHSEAADGDSFER